MKKSCFVAITCGLLCFLSAEANATPPIYVPWTCGETHNITQGNKGNYSHKAGSKEQYAWDTGMSIGTPILAPAAGTITHIKQDSNKNCTSSCSDANYVAMTFDEGNAAVFVHLKYQGANVSKGQHVNRGDVIAYSGNTGWSTGPHLHFQIQQACGSWWCNTIETPWVGFGIPQYGQSIKSNNCCSTEICDGLDNDCDGQVDEGGVCAPDTEAQFQSMMYDPQNTDINGDGLADVCGRGAAGLYCELSQKSGFSDIKLVLSNVSNENGWNGESNYPTFRFADINGDGKADFCGRAHAGIECWLSNGTGFGNAFTFPQMKTADGYNDVKYYSTIRFADVNGDGKDDFCARFKDGFKCYLSTGSNFDKELAVGDMADSTGWADEKYYSTIRTADINGDGKVDVCARGSAGFRCWPSKGDSFGSEIPVLGWSNDNGWGVRQYYATIRMPDLNGDGKADVCARASGGITCHLSNGNGWGGDIAGPGWSDAYGWNDYDNYSTIMFGDIDGDGKDDICARANANISCQLSTGNGFGKSASIAAFSDGNGWNKPEQYRTIRMADVNGDGKMEVCGRGSDGFACYTFNGSEFVASSSTGSFSDASGWNHPEYYSTLRAGGPIAKSCSKQEEICDGIDNDCDGEIDENDVCNTCKPSNEICDGIDNDCDGEIDEGDACCVPTPEVCDAVDNDCDGEIDEGDVCDHCEPQEEICDAVDNDCDGEIDENDVCDHCEPQEEVCDGIDNNCNGLIDEGGVCKTPGSDDTDSDGAQLANVTIVESCSSTPAQNAPLSHPFTWILALLGIATLTRKRKNN